MTASIVVSDLHEEFRIEEDRATSIKEVVSRFRFIRGRTRIPALRGVSFEVPQGQTLGLIGENGSGKSTLLRCIAGILPPTSGGVLIAGRVASLIELGAGFHHELTGRENLEVSGVLFGLRRRELMARMDQIISFAELESVIEHPVRSYSSGMIVRLAFSLAVHTDPEILLVDEVLAVGDESFQRKCIRRIGQLKDDGITIVFVSHDLQLVRQICDRCLLLDHGKVVADGPSEQVVQHYLQTVEEASTDG